MKIDRLRIKKFRSIFIAEIRVGSIVAIVGKNNSGKSSLLKALNCFFNPEQEKESFISGAHEHTAGSIPTIEIEFSNIPSTNPFPISKKTEKVWVRFQWKNGKEVYSYKSEAKYSALSDQQISEFKKSIHFQLIPPARDYANLHRIENNILKQILASFISKRQRDTISPKLKALATQVRSKLRDIEKKVKENYFLDQNLKFALGYEQTNDDTLNFISNFNFKIQEQEKEFIPEECGSGIQSLLIIALYKYLADLSHSSYLIGIEEPESNLHPQSQGNLTEELRELAKGKKITVLASTHSPHIIDSLDHTEIVLCQKSYNDGGRPITRTTQLPEDYWSKYSLTKVKNDLFFKYKNSDFFFSDKIIICEGRTDSEVILKLASENDVNLTKLGISILTLEGIGNLNYPYTLVNELDLENLIIIDKDFFLPYKNGSLEKSRDSKKFPVYVYKYKSENETLINRIISEKSDRNSLLELFKKNHAQALRLLEKYNLIIFRWNLEVDLCNSEKALQEFAKTFRPVPKGDLNEEIIEKRKEAIKDSQRIEKVLNKIQPRNYPVSYSRIKNKLKEMSKKRHKENQKS